jgi:hypothetical protein
VLQLSQPALSEFATLCWAFGKSGPIAPWKPYSPRSLFITYGSSHANVPLTAGNAHMNRLVPAAAAAPKGAR